MFDAVLFSFLSVVAVSLISLIGISTFLIQRFQKEEVMHFLVSFAAGALLGDVFFHIFPEIVKEYSFAFFISVFILLGIIIFFILEKFLSWHHCHGTHQKGMDTCDHKHAYNKKNPAPFVYMNLFADGLHNFIDGMIIAASYITSIPIGIATTIAVVFHEIPQEIGDFAILIHGGFSRAKALLYNFLSAITSILGAGLVFLIGANPESLHFILAFTAGGFVYLALADLVPELHKEPSMAKSFLHFFGMILGMAIMAVMLLVE